MADPKLPLDGDEPNVIKPAKPDGSRIRETVRFTGESQTEKRKLTERELRELSAADFARLTKG